MSNKSFIIVAIILIAVAFGSISAYMPARFDAAAETRVENFPRQFGEWSSRDIEVDARTYENLETTNLFVREYTNPEGEAVYLYIVYSEDNRKVSHPPEVCMLGSGLTVADKSQVQLTEDIKATRIFVEKGEITEMIVYWYKAGDLNTDKYLKQQLKVVVDRLSGKRTSCALVRLSALIQNQDQDAAFNLLRRFAVEIEPLLDRYVP